MHVFHDDTGRAWALSIHVTALKHVRAATGRNLYKLVDDGFAGLAELLGDPIEFVDTLYVLCRDQCGKEEVTDEDFGRLMHGDTIARATDAFNAELADFFHDPRLRAGVRKVIEKGRRVQELMMARLAEQIELVDAERIAETLSGSSGSAPESSASTPAPSPSAS